MFKTFNMNLCSCPCHKKGIILKHVIPCCDKSGIQYINSDGSIDYNLIEKNDKNKLKNITDNTGKKND